MHHRDALERLMVGNRRYAATRQMHPRQTKYDRQLLVDGQHPFAAILSCSDSRVPSELIFDQGLGDLFIVRTAGHAVDDLVFASLEYSVHALQVPLIMVLGHTQCGAITSVMRGEVDYLPGHLPQLAVLLRPSLSTIDPAADDSIAHAIQANSRATAHYLAAHSPVFSDAIHNDRLRIVAAQYALASGRVELLGV
jgi:carbonic anhydrase